MAARASSSWLLPAVALVPVLVFAAWDALQGDGDGALVRLALLAPPAGFTAWWLGARILGPALAEHTHAHREAGKAEGPARVERLEWVRAEYACERALERARQVRELAGAGLSVHASASRTLAFMSGSSADAAGDDVAHREIRRIAVRACDLLHHARSLAQEIRCAHVLDDDPADADSDVAYALQQAVNLLEPTFERLGVRVRVRVLDGPLPRCVGDIRSLQLVFVRLLESAADALAAGVLELQCRLLEGGLAVEVRLPAAVTRALSDARASLCEHLVTRFGGTLEFSGELFGELAGELAGDDRDIGVRVRLPVA